MEPESSSPYPQVFITKKKLFFCHLYIILKRFIAQRVYAVCTGINYKIVPVTSLNKYGTIGTE
jgi:hypothetical protein